MAVTQQVTVRLTQKDHYRFEVDWSLPTHVKGIVDEPPPIGAGDGPNASRMVAVAVSHCLSSSLLFCMEKSHTPFQGLETTALAEITRNDKGRWRLTKVTVTLDPKIPESAREQFERCKGLFEDYCIVTEAVRKGITVDVRWAEPPAATTAPA